MEEYNSPYAQEPQEQEDDSEKYDINKLNQLYREAETCDQDIFAEIRSNINIMSGTHWKKISQGIDRNMRGLKVEKSKRLRLVKNHTSKAITDVKDILASLSPGVMPYPVRDKEPSDQKVAEQAKKVWGFVDKKNSFAEMKEKFRNCFVTTGEVCAKVYWNPIKGGLRGFKQKVDEFGQPLFLDENGQETTAPIGVMGQQHEMAPDQTQPEFKGLVTVEKFEPYNLLRPKNATDLRQAKWLCYRKMVDLDEARALIKNSQLKQEEKQQRLEMIKSSGETTYKIFDGTSGSFQDSDGQILLKEFFFRQSPQFPRGYYFIACEHGILFEGELPFGEFGEIAYPIKWNYYEGLESCARGVSLIRRIKPAQLEVNRCASAIAETQVTVGWDKLVLTKNAKFSRGIDQPGLRVFHTTDGEPIVIPGRSGDQFIGYLEHNISEIYRLANLPENANPAAQAVDPRTELFKTQRQKARFTEAAERLSRFFAEICESAIFLAQQYMDEADLAEILGPQDAADLVEFKQSKNLPIQIKIMEVSDDIESMTARALELETVIQYVGKNLDQDMTKVLISQFPMLNKSRALSTFLIDRENVESDILALDRGEWREANRYDEHEVYVKMLTHRMKQNDFQMLNPQIQQMYQERLKQHEEAIAQLAKEQQEAEAGFIPSGGALAKADLYVNPDPNNPLKTQRAVFPTEALQWLKKRLDAQGTTQDMMQTIGNAGAIGDISQMVGAQQQQQQGQQQGQMPQEPQQSEGGMMSPEMNPYNTMNQGEF
jgi:hypothetical protein